MLPKIAYLRRSPQNPSVLNPTPIPQSKLLETLAHERAKNENLVASTLICRRMAASVGVFLLRHEGDLFSGRREPENHACDARSVRQGEGLPQGVRNGLQPRLG